jgi:chemotaxis protein MotB
MAAAKPIIVIKKKINHAGHHGGAWKVAYADFVTALMALFIVLWLLNSSKPVKEAVSGYFKDPSGKSNKSGNGAAGSGDQLNVNRDNMGQIKEELQKAMREVKGFDQLKDQVEMTVTGEGLRIELMETEQGTFFPSGAPEPNSSGKEILEKLAHELGGLPNKISVEGHTDATPYAGDKSYSNWELSADRANAARRLMQESGLGHQQVTQVRGYADQRLRKADKPNDASNRRISVIVQYQAPAGEEGKPPAAAAAPAAHGAAAPAAPPGHGAATAAAPAAHAAGVPAAPPGQAPAKPVGGHH